MKDEDDKTGGKIPVDLSKYYRLDIFTFIIPDDFWILSRERPRKTDVTGYTKLIEDAIVNYINIDDSYNIDVLTTKRPIPYEGIDHSFIIVRFYEMPLDRLDVGVLDIDSLPYVTEALSHFEQVVRTARIRGLSAI